MTMRMTTILTIALVALGLGSTGVFAGDGKNYTGAFCQSNNTAIVYGVHGAYNTSASHIPTFYCPAVKETSASIKFGWMRVIDRHPSMDFTCTLWSDASHTAQQWGWWSTKRSGGESPNPQLLTFDGLPDFDDGHYIFTCEVPTAYAGQSSGVVSYHLEEN